ncbi:MAG: hypothetical protein R3E53_08775 [Myxococcota bacterium]
MNPSSTIAATVVAIVRISTESGVTTLTKLRKAMKRIVEMTSTVIARSFIGSVKRIRL